MALLAIIEDGYTRHSRVKGVRGMYPDIDFRWRPCTVIQRATFAGATNQSGLSAAQRETVGGEILAKQLLEWNVADRNGRVLPINANTVLSLHGHAFNRLYSIVVAMAAAPDEELDDNGDVIVAMVAAAEASLSLEDYLAKNS